MINATQNLEHVQWFEDHQRFRRNIMSLLEIVSSSESEIIEHEKNILEQADLAHESQVSIHKRMNLLMEYARELHLLK